MSAPVAIDAAARRERPAFDEFDAPAERVGYALAATWQIDALAELLADRMRDSAEDQAVYAMALRIRELAGATVSALDDERQTLQHIHHQVHGNWRQEAEGD